MRTTDVSNNTVVSLGTNIQFTSHEYVSDVEPFHEPESLFTVPWIDPLYWYSKELVEQNVSDEMLPGTVP